MGAEVDVGVGMVGGSGLGDCCPATLFAPTSAAPLAFFFLPAFLWAWKVVAAHAHVHEMAHLLVGRAKVQLAVWWMVPYLCLCLRW